MILTETWKADTLKINIGFWNYSQVYPKHKNAIRHSGGITVFAKNHIIFGIKLVEDAGFWKTDFRKLKKLLIQYKDRKGDILIMGDLNARTRSQCEKLVKQVSQLLPDTEITTLETGNRCSCDVKVNTSGRKLLTICS